MPKSPAPFPVRGGAGLWLLARATDARSSVVITLPGTVIACRLSSARSYYRSVSPDITPESQCAQLGPHQGPVQWGPRGSLLSID